MTPETQPLDPLACLLTLTPGPAGRDALASLLRAGAGIVRETEPGTPRWYALADEGRDGLGIFDTFRGPEARDQHFAGEVAAALHARASSLVEGGWEGGVLPGVHHYAALSATAVDRGAPTLATLVRFTARPGRAEEVARLLAGAAATVADTEPGTLFWTALRRDGAEDEFAIFDVFADAEGRAAHFAGKVAAALRDASEGAVVGGWEGVLAGVRHFEILAAR